MIQYTKLDNGEWGIKSTEKLEEGKIVVVSKKVGQANSETIDKYYGIYTGYTPVEDTYGVVDWYCYTIKSKYSSESVKAGTYKKSASGKKIKTTKDVYDLFIWKFSGGAYTNTAIWIDYVLEVKLEGIGKKQAEEFVKLYEGKSEYIALAKNRNASAGSYRVTSRDIYNTQSIYLMERLYKQYLISLDEKELVDKKWLMCAMNCKMFPARSQKIKGVREATSYLNGCVDKDVITSAVVVSYNEDIEIETHVHDNYSILNGLKDGNGNRYGRFFIDEVIKNTIGKFMRPCPTTPVHGFVESRLVESSEEVLGVIEEIKKCGEVPEFIVMERVWCDYSGVVTPDSISMGKGNAGATGGEDAFFIPLQLGAKDKEHYRELFWNNAEWYCKKCHISFSNSEVQDLITESGSDEIYCNKCNGKIERKWPYCEVLYQGDVKQPSMVQLRAGPSLETVEEEIKVSEIVEVSSKESSPLFRDLIEWEKISKKLAEKVKIVEGVKVAPLVWHPGGAPSSHYGVHCREQGVPYSIGYEEPKVGETVKVGVKSETNIVALREGIVLGLGAKIECSGYEDVKIKHELVNFLGSLHISALADLGEDKVARFIGYSWALGARIIAALPFGESVHNSGAREDVRGVVNKAMPKNERDYVRVWKLDLETIMRGLVVCYEGFRGYKWAGGYGGKAWAGCTQALLEVFIEIREFIRVCNSENMQKLLESINKMVNMAHNNGWWLNKLLLTQDFDNAAMLPHFSLHPRVAFRCVEEFEKVKGFGLQVKGFKLGNSIEISREIFEDVVVEKNDSYNSNGCTCEDCTGAYDEDKDTFGEDVFDVENSDEVEEKEEMDQEQIKAMLIGEAIEAQYKMSGSNIIHIQIKCNEINREYGYSNNYSIYNGGLKNKGEVVVSLANSGVSYHKCKIYMSTWQYNLIVEAMDFKGSVIYATVYDSILWDKFEEIKSYQQQQ